MKRYRWNWKKCLANVCMLGIMSATGIGLAWLVWLWALA